jgi:hypothetical protein
MGLRTQRGQQRFVAGLSPQWAVFWKVSGSKLEGSTDCGGRRSYRAASRWCVSPAKKTIFAGFGYCETELPVEHDASDHLEMSTVQGDALDAELGGRDTIKGRLTGTWRFRPAKRRATSPAHARARSFIRRPPSCISAERVGVRVPALFSCAVRGGVAILCSCISLGRIRAS